MKRYNCVLQLNLSYFRAATHDYDAKSFSAAACLARSYLKGPKQPHSAHLHVQVLLSQVIEGGEGPVTPRPSRKKLLLYIGWHLFWAGISESYLLLMRYVTTILAPGRSVSSITPSEVVFTTFCELYKKLPFFRCASISWFDVVSGSVINIFLQLAHLRVFQSY